MYRISWRFTNLTSKKEVALFSPLLNIVSSKKYIVLGIGVKFQ